MSVAADVAVASTDASTDAATSALTVPGNDRAFLYGDGVFETLLLTRGTLLFLPLHLDRLLEGAKRLRIDVSRDQLAVELASCIEQRPEHHAVVRITVSRGGGRRGYRPTQGAGCNIHSALSELSDDPLSAREAAQVNSSTIRMAAQPLLAGIKHCNRLEQVLAAMEAEDMEVDDVLLCREGGQLQCSSNANVFCVRGDALLTPPCDVAGVAGTRRRLILDKLAGLAGFDARVQPLTLDDLDAADAVFLSNSVMGIRAVASLDGRPVGRSDAVSELQKLYREEALACCAG